MVRTQPTNGLSGAVLHGMAAARGKFLCVMDADLQHPPEKLPELLRPLHTGEADFVLGSRYMPGGSTEGEWGFFRKINSRIATLLARPFAGKATDPMAGFFALKRETYMAAQNLTPLGYKIALELMCKCRAKNVREIPIHFGMRLKGESKLSLKQQFRYLEHLSRLYDFTFPRASPMVKFLVATGASWLAGLAAFLLLIHAAIRINPVHCRGIRRRAVGDGDLSHPICSDAAGVPAAANALAGFRGHLRRRVDRRDSRRMVGGRAIGITGNFRDVRDLFRIRDGHSLYISERVSPGHPRTPQGNAQGNEVSTGGNVQVRACRASRPVPKLR